MLSTIRRSLSHRVRSSALMNVAARREARLDRNGGHPLAADPTDHLIAAMEWLIRAHDATSDDGVSRGYSVAWDPYFHKGWQPSYPETTGYIIPTFFDLAQRFALPDLRNRAIRMADWEVEVQLASGAVQGGVISEQDPPTPAVFNTGQVILGWLRAHRETSCGKYLDAARRGADFLLTAQGPDGAFRTGHSQFARADCGTYNTRVAWALCELGKYTDDHPYVDAGIRNIQFGISQQASNGWFSQNCLLDPDRPLLHTIAYAVRGILEAGLLLEREDFVQSACETARALITKQRRDGGLAGRFSADWSEQAEWDCLTGDAQMAIIWWKLAWAVDDAELRERAVKIWQFVARSQNRSSSIPGLAGGIKGSFPFDEPYGCYQTLNWATKFFVDAGLLTTGGPVERQPPGAPL